MNRDSLHLWISLIWMALLAAGFIFVLLYSQGRLDLEVKVFWKHRRDYEWHLCDADDVTIAQGRADSFAKALAAGEKQALRLMETESDRLWPILIQRAADFRALAQFETAVA